jgi:hypothetical protein
LCACPEGASEGVALGLSLTTTLGSVVLLGAIEDGYDAPRSLLALGFAGVVLGPTTGHVYAGHYVTRGLVVRLAGLGVAAFGIFAAPCPPDSHSSVCPSLPIVTAGAGLFLAGMFDDFLTLPATVRRRNARGLAIGPSLGGRGLAIAGNF